MDSLVAMGTSAAFIYSLYAIWQICREHGLPCTCTLKPQGYITLILLRKTLKPLPKDVHPMPLRSLWICTKDGGGNPGRKEITIPVEEVEFGDVIVVRLDRVSRLMVR